MRTRWTYLALLGASLSIGCDVQVAEGPPNLRYGQDTCAHCGMIVNEERHAAAITIATAGRREHLAFDDIGDLLDYEREHPELEGHRRYVHDFQTRQWIDATSATIVVSPDLHTPMGSGLAAFATRESAESMRGRIGGTVLVWSDAMHQRTAAAQVVSQEDSNKACCSGVAHDPQSAVNTGR